MAERIRLVVLFGGRSAEHEVSCTTAVNVLQALDPAHYEVVPVGVTHEGRWVLAEEAAKVLAAGGPSALPPALARLCADRCESGLSLSQFRPHNSRGEIARLR